MQTKLDPSAAITQALAEHPDARPIPVRNVAYWGTNVAENRLNLELDTRLYSWRGETLRAIKRVLKLQSKL